MLNINVTVIMGVLIILTGIALVGVQVLEGGNDKDSFKLIGAEAGTSKFQVETTFPGMPTIALGMILLISGAILSRERVR